MVRTRPESDKMFGDGRRGSVRLDVVLGPSNTPQGYI